MEKVAFGMIAVACVMVVVMVVWALGGGTCSGS